MQLFDPSKVKLMGVVNVTPDSFSDGGRYIEADVAIEHGFMLAGQGADMLDIGGESTRPGAEPVELHEELRRVIPVIEGLSKSIDIPISVDTCKSEVAAEAIGAGASIVNDISAFRFDPSMASLCAESGVRVILMHMLGEPRNMQVNPFYDDVLSQIFSFLEERAAFAVEAGIDKERIMVDPGIGFGKRQQDNLEILGNISVFRGLGHPIVVGTSRKSFIGNILKAKSTDERLFGSLGSFAWCAVAGADILRVHDVAETARMLSVISELHSKSGTEENKK